MKSASSQDPNVTATTRPLVPLPLTARTIPQSISPSSILLFETGEHMQDDAHHPMPLPLAVDVEPISSQSSDYRPMPLPGGSLPIEPRRSVPLPLSREVEVEPISSQSSDYRPMPLPGNGLAQLEGRKPVPMPHTLQKTEQRKIIPLPLRLLPTPEDSFSSAQPSARRPDRRRTPFSSQVPFDFSANPPPTSFAAQVNAPLPVPSSPSKIHSNVDMEESRSYRPDFLGKAPRDSPPMHAYWLNMVHIMKAAGAELPDVDPLDPSAIPPPFLAAKHRAGPDYEPLVIPPASPNYRLHRHLPNAMHDVFVEYAIGWIAHSISQPKNVRVRMLRALQKELEQESLEMQKVALTSANLQYRLQELRT
ncbi:hypothetical protein EUX98_g9581 [Antrodiella citrinella]|uniref:Uncharacterized protein n=1 Tax=Antrodiella citrinella TaxID=2447956 RepID=A0A4S4LSJ2_9APHY|nr:hypothetical protein EUX98_g9581 [Antrodiella citrinella]